MFRNYRFDTNEDSLKCYHRVYISMTIWYVIPVTKCWWKKRVIVNELELVLILMKCCTLCGIIINRPAGPAIAIPFFGQVCYMTCPFYPVSFVLTCDFSKVPQFIDAITNKVHYLKCGNK